MKKLIFPVAVVLMAAGAAFATKAAKNSKAPVDAYRIDAVSGQCISTDQQCEDFGTTACTWSEDPSVTLHAKPVSGTMCGNELYQLKP